MLDEDTEVEVGIFEEASVDLEERAEVPDKVVADAKAELGSPELCGALVVEVRLSMVDEGAIGEDVPPNSHPLAMGMLGP